MITFTTAVFLSVLFMFTSEWPALWMPPLDISNDISNGVYHQMPISNRVFQYGYISYEKNA